MTILVLLTLFFSAFPALLYWRNAKLFLTPPAILNPRAISVLIPARNEERGIAACLQSIQANTDVEWEAVVLDDHSTDSTPDIVRKLAESDPRIRLEHAPELPTGWSGKQHACFVLAQHARYETLMFLDADVRLEPTALARMAGFLDASGSALVSGFPRQETGTFLEKLIVPFINWLLLSYLPISRMRLSTQVGLGAGCGQWFCTTRATYHETGGHGHEWVRGSFHDGIKLPRAYRSFGLKTDFCDATQLATCRMYRSAGQVWNGFAKNAREGMAAPKQILIWSFLLSMGHLLPFVLLAFVPVMEPWQIAVVALATLFSLAPRIAGAIRFRQSFLSAILHPFGILALLGIQWYATFRWAIGKPIGWRGRFIPTA